MDIITLQQRYSYVYGRLIRTVLSHFGEPIADNLVKVFSSLFEANYFRKFLWLAPNNVKTKGCESFGEYVFELDKTLISQQFKEPYLYHAEAISVVVYLMDNLEECGNIFKTHIKSTLRYEYLFYLLSKRDYYTDETSSDINLKLHLILKVQVIKLIDRIYLQDQQPPHFYDLLREFLSTQSKLYDVFINEFPSRKETLDFRRALIGRGRRQDEKYEYLHKLYSPAIKDMYSNEMELFRDWRTGMLDFVVSTGTSQSASKVSSICKDIELKIIRLNEMLYETKPPEAKIEMNYEWLIETKGKTDYQRRLKAICSGWLLESISSQALTMRAM